MDTPYRPIRHISAELHQSRHTSLNTVDLARALLTQWSVNEGKAFEEALHTCLTVLVDEDRPPQEARAAFVKAAREAGIVVLSDDG
ncbi:DUF982 domain-containing protein [Sinorhizobium sp. CB7]